LIFGYSAATLLLTSWSLPCQHHYGPLQVDEDASAVVNEGIWVGRKRRLVKLINLLFETDIGIFSTSALHLYLLAISPMLFHSP